jgi:hypothetical protein
MLFINYCNSQVLNTNPTSINSAGGNSILMYGVNGSLFTTGTFTGTTDLNPGSGINLHTATSSSAMFVQCLSPSNDFIWAKSFQNCVPSKIILGSAQIYIVGSFTGTVDFNPNTGITNLTSNGQSDAFILKLDLATGDLVFVKQIGGSGNDNAEDIAFEFNQTNNSVYITGTFNSTVDFDPNGNVSSLTSSGLNDIYVLKLNDNGQFTWAKRLGSTGNDVPTCLKIIGTSIILSGTYTGTVDFNPNFGISNITSSNWTSQASFLLSLGTNGLFQWVRNFDANNGPSSIRSFTFASNSIIIVGDLTGSMLLPLVGGGVIQTPIPNNLDAGFIINLDLNGLVNWCRLIDNPTGSPQSFVAPTCVESDGGNNSAIYIVGRFMGTTNFNISNQNEPYNLDSQGESGFFMKIYQDGTFQWAYKLESIENNNPKICLTKHGGYNHIGATGMIVGSQDFDLTNVINSTGNPGIASSFSVKWTDNH